MMTETWAPVPEQDGYEVSDQGRVRHGARVLRCTPGPNGYPKTRFGRNGPELYVHRLVMLAFVGPPPEGQEVRHRDGNPSNPALANLQYGTHSENMQDQISHGMNPRLNKTHCPQGHAYDGDNLYARPGKRICRTCAREALRRWRARRAAAGLPYR